jgi:hypothetical protein
MSLSRDWNRRDVGAMQRFGLALATAAFVAVGMTSAAFACACCSQPGQRTVEVAALNAEKLGVFKALRFAPRAELYMTEAGEESYEGIDGELSQYALKASWQGNRLVFALDDGNGYAGTLALELPARVSIFEVDPRTLRETNAGPLLYKEWKVTGKVSGTGKFAKNSGPNQLLTLIAQGNGIGCTSAQDFTHWSLVMQGPKANYMFFGKLTK